LFLFISLMVQAFWKKSKILQTANVLLKPIKIEKWKLIGFAGLQVITILLVCINLIDLSGGKPLSEAIGYVRTTNLFTDENLSLPRILREMKCVCTISGYIWGYIFIYNSLLKYKKNIVLIICNFLLSMGCMLTDGARTNLIQLIVATLVMWYILNGRIKGWRKKTNMKYAIFCVAALMALVFGFQGLGNLMGRESVRTAGEYIAIYMSAELKNLDSFVRTGDFGAPIEKWQTLIYVVNYIGNRFGISSLVHELDTPFLYVLFF